MVLERPLNDLVKDIWCDELMNICSGEVVCERLYKKYVLEFAKSDEVIVTHHDIANKTVFIPKYPKLQFTHK